MPAGFTIFDPPSVRLIINYLQLKQLVKQPKPHFRLAVFFLFRFQFEAL
jgi:hypothetical protein